MTKKCYLKIFLLDLMCILTYDCQIKPHQRKTLYILKAVKWYLFFLCEIHVLCTNKRYRFHTLDSTSSTFEYLLGHSHHTTLYTHALIEISLAHICVNRGTVVTHYFFLSCVHCLISYLRFDEKPSFWYVYIIYNKGFFLFLIKYVVQATVWRLCDKDTMRLYIFFLFKCVMPHLLNPLLSKTGYHFTVVTAASYFNWILNLIVIIEDGCVPTPRVLLS